MKTYYVTTQTSLNKHLLHSLMVPEFSTSDLAEAEAIFRKEVEQLKEEYLSINSLDYSPNEKDLNHAVYCSITAIDSEEEDEVIFIQDSDFFF